MKISETGCRSIIWGIELGKNPEIGEALTGQFKGMYKYRVGSWRVIYSILSDCVLILRTGHRSVVYK